MPVIDDEDEDNNDDDENSNDELDKNFLGLPKERVGVSHQTSFGKPNFQRSKFELSDKKTLDLTVTFLN